jgi:type III secretory pathway lipoprotein EscJ
MLKLKLFIEGKRRLIKALNRQIPQALQHMQGAAQSAIECALQLRAATQETCGGKGDA